ncbi:cysteine--tRNA ligase [Fuchsiella alkaliacetigena]|uniref:cysteine--tRNA ligase n=1 Tax=Fuchsiella alkaliacetigena TaxID=957042 RepID=UPI0035589EBC
MKIYNTLTRKKEEFQPIDEEQVKIYTCGPTVYDYFHIGNARAFVIPDILKRYLEYKGYQVFHIVNFTDIDDKMINRAEEEGVNIEELAERFIEAYFEDTKRLNIKKADAYPKATEHIYDIIELIEILEEEEYAYEVDGDVFFAVKQFEDYGKLSNQSLEELASGSRVDINEKKRNPLDFVLWKNSKAGEPSWDSPWGAGRPGWHTECSVMSMFYLGRKFDFHTGGVDLVFPHHENEIAQSEAVTESQVVNYWLHNGYINIDGEKMSKSLGNFFTTREIFAEYDPQVVRFFLISKHYRSPINFSDAELAVAQKGLERLKNTVQRLDNLIAGDQQELKPGSSVEYEELTELIETKKKKFVAAMDDDLNTALAIGSLHELAKELNTLINTSDLQLAQGLISTLEKAADFFAEAGEVLGLEFSGEEIKDDNLVAPLIELLLKIRSEAREEQNWDLADQIRDELAELGVKIEDTAQGVEWKLE